MGIFFFFVAFLWREKRRKVWRDDVWKEGGGGREVMCM